MMSDWTLDIAWWLTVVEIPALAGLLMLIWRVRNELDSTLTQDVSRVDTSLLGLRENLNAHKLEVAQGYASAQDLRDTEGRLTDRLMRIETKLDNLGFHP